MAKLTDVGAAILDLFRLDGRIALVIGGSGGLGEAMSLAFAGAGANVAVASNQLEGCQRVAADVESLGREALALFVDVRSYASIQEVVANVMERWGRIDILVNSAGTGHQEPTVTFPEDLWDRIIDINLKSIFLACKAVAPIMLKQQYGKIINLSSVRGFQGRTRDAAYPASKGGVNLMTKSFALEWAKDNITVNAIAPTFFRTPMTKSLMADPEKSAWVMSRSPMGRIGEPEDLMGAALFLASDASRFVTGHVLLVDGGWTAA